MLRQDAKLLGGTDEILIGRTRSCSGTPTKLSSMQD